MSKESIVFAAANVCGIALYTYLFLQIAQRIHYEQRTDADFGDGFAFLTTAFLVLLIFVAVDLIWVAVMANQHRKYKDSKAAMLFGIVAIAAWAATVFVLRLVP